MSLLLLSWTRYYLQFASEYALFFQRREPQSAMLEEAPGLVTFPTRSITLISLAQKETASTILSEQRPQICERPEWLQEEKKTQ
jgi:hypothetical protein